MSNTIKVELDKLYRVSPVKSNFTGGSKPSIEIYSANSAVTIRATTNGDFEDTYANVPEVTDSAASGEVYVTDCADSIKFMSFSCSDTDAVILVSGFNLIVSPVHKIDTFSVSTIGTGYKVGDKLKIEDGATVTPCFQVVTFEQTDGTLKTVTVTEAGSSDTDYAGTVDVEYGSGENGEVTLTSTSTTTYFADSATVATAGTGYAVDDVLTYSSGVTGDVDATFKVLTVDTNGEVLTVEIVNSGSFASDIAGTLTVTGGTGSGAELTVVSDTIVEYSIDTATITDAGSGYGSEDFVIDLEGGAKLTFETESVGESMTVRMLEDGEFASALTSSAKETTTDGSGEGTEITITTKPIY